MKTNGSVAAVAAMSAQGSSADVGWSDERHVTAHGQDTERYRNNTAAVAASTSGYVHRMPRGNSASERR